MTPEEAIELVVAGFPFEKYTDHERGAYLTIARSALRYLPRGASVLDFGCGPCDKTAVLQHLGYRCFACDDLRDDWHGTAGARDRIIAFARANGIEFRLTSDGASPFENQWFDLLMMLDVLEHLHDSPRDLLNDLLLRVKPQGLFLATVPNGVNIRKRLDVIRGRTNLPRYDGYYWYPGPWRGHIREYVREDLVKLAGYLGLEIVEL
ncbi:MAG: class I SAM-dependent methyltransferase, partial [Gemmatimonadales bacterium]